MLKRRPVFTDAGFLQISASYTALNPLGAAHIRDLIPSRYPSNTWRGFFMRVATIAIAALVVLGVINLFDYLQSPKPSHTLEPTRPSSQSNP